MPDKKTKANNLRNSTELLSPLKFMRQNSTQLDAREFMIEEGIEYDDEGTPIT
jgi:hypothetical protein